MRVRWFVRSLIVLAALALALPAFAEDVPRPIARSERNPLTALASVGAKTASQAGMGQYVNPSNPICTQTWHQGNVYRTDCEGNAPDNETSIAIDPSDPNRILGAANDYQLAAIPGAASRTVAPRSGTRTSSCRTPTTADRIGPSRRSSRSDPAPG
jgi:hypothetical protein